MTKKPIIQVVLEEEYYQELKKLAQANDRSMSKQSARIIKKYIDDIRREKPV